MKVLDLFSGTQSVKKALKEINIKFEYYGVDIYSPEEKNIILDLSQENIIEKLIEKLPKNWKPNFIWASPVCNKFSVATAVKGGNVYFERTKTGIKPRTNMEVLKRTQFKNYTKEHIAEQCKLHLKLVENMQIIIDYFDCDFVIENPKTSYISHILNPLYVKNNVDYCMYGFDYKKPTSIYSKYNLNLKTCSHKKHSENMQNDIKNYKNRAEVPPKLIKEIIRKIISYEK